MDRFADLAEAYRAKDWPAIEERHIREVGYREHGTRARRVVEAQRIREEVAERHNGGTIMDNSVTVGDRPYAVSCGINGRPQMAETFSSRKEAARCWKKELRNPTWDYCSITVTAYPPGRSATREEADALWEAAMQRPEFAKRWGKYD